MKVSLLFAVGDDRSADESVKLRQTNDADMVEQAGGMNQSEPAGESNPFKYIETQKSSLQGEVKISVLYFV